MIAPRAPRVKYKNLPGRGKLNKGPDPAFGNVPNMGLFVV